MVLSLLTLLYVILSNNGRANHFHNPDFLCLDMKLRCSFQKQILEINKIPRQVSLCAFSRFLLDGRENRPLLDEKLFVQYSAIF